MASEKAPGGSDPLEHAPAISLSITANGNLMLQVKGGDPVEIARLVPGVWYEIGHLLPP